MIVYQLIQPETGNRSEIECVTGTLQELADLIHSTFVKLQNYLNSATWSEQYIKDNPDATDDDLHAAISAARSSFLNSYVLVLIDNSTGVGSFSKQPLFRVNSLLPKFGYSNLTSNS